MIHDKYANFKVVVTVDIIPEGMPTPQIIDFKNPPIAHVVINATAVDEGVLFTDIDMALPQNPPAIIDTAGRATELIGGAIRRVARGDKSGVNSEELREYDKQGNVISSTQLHKRTLN